MNHLFLSNYSPGLVDNSALEAILVQRERLIASIVKKIQSDQARTHYLLVGPPGIGKTSTITLICSRLRSGNKNDWSIARLNEESWGITSYLDFLYRIHRALVVGQEDASLLANINVLLKVDVLMAERTLEEALEELAVGKNVLVVAESLDEVFREIGKQGQKKLRAFIQNNRQFTFLTSAKDIFSAISSYAAPFYGFFEIVHLKPFSTEESLEFLEKVAKVSNNKAVQRILKTPEGVARAKALHHLSGGNPRVFMLFYGVLASDSIESVVSPVIRILDDLTPAYYARMMQLSPQQRKIVEALADSPTALTVKAISEELFITQQSASSQLRELKIRQVVESRASGRESYYDLKEPFFKLCIQLKNNKVEFVNGLLSFLEAWYAPSDLPTNLMRLSGHGSIFSQVFDQYQSKHARQFAEMPERLNRFNKTRLEEKNAVEITDLEDLRAAVSDRDFSDALMRVSALVDREPSAELRKMKGLLEFRLGRAADAEKTVAADEDPDEIMLQLLMDSYCRMGQYEEAMRVAERAILLHPESEELLLSYAWTLMRSGRFEKALVSLDQILSSSPMNEKAILLHAECNFSEDRFIECLADLKKIERNLDSTLIGDILLLKSAALLSSSQRTKAARELDRVLTFEVSNEVRALALARKGTMLEGSKPLQAIRLYRQALRLEPRNSGYWMLLALVFKDREKYRASIGCSDQVLKISPGEPEALWNKAVCYSATKQPELALRLFTELESTLKDDPNLLKNVASVLIELERFEPALDKLERLPLREYESESGLCYLRALCLYELGRYEQAHTWIKKMPIKGCLKNSDAAETLSLAISWRMKNWSEIEETYRSISQVTPASLCVYVSALAEQEKLHEALLCLSANEDLLEGNAALWLLRGSLEYRSEKFELAQKSFARAYLLDPTDEEALFLTMVSLIGEGKYAESVGYFAKLDQLGKEHRRILIEFMFEEATECDTTQAVDYLTFLEALEKANVDSDFIIAAKSEILLTLGDLDSAVSLFTSDLRRPANRLLQRLIEKTLVVSLEQKRVYAIEILIAKFAQQAMLATFGASFLRFIIAQLELGVSAGVLEGLLLILIQFSNEHKSELKRTVSLCRLVVEFAKTHDRKILAQIPIEERALLEQWLNQQGPMEVVDEY